MLNHNTAMRSITHQEINSISADMADLSEEDFVSKYKCKKADVIATINRVANFAKEEKYFFRSVVPSVDTRYGKSYKCYSGHDYKHKVIHHSPDCAINCAIESLNKPFYLIVYTLKLDKYDEDYPHIQDAT